MQPNSGLTVEQFQQALGTTSQIAGVWAAPLLSAMERFEINTPARQAAYLAEIGYESDGLQDLVEDLNYRASALLEQWPEHFTQTTANLYGRTDSHDANQEAIANIAYANRFGNGGISSGDGWKYRGRGPIQTTFLDNYSAVETACGIPCVENPDLLSEPEGGALASAFYFYSHGCNQLADIGDFRTITEKIQGGLAGYAGREAHWVIAKKALNV